MDVEENNLYKLVPDTDENSDIELENCYYTSKSLKSINSLGALSGLHRIVNDVTCKPMLRFKAIKQILLINFNLKHYDEVIKFCPVFLSFNSDPECCIKLEKAMLLIGKILETIEDDNVVLEICKLQSNETQNKQLLGIVMIFNNIIAKIYYKRKQYNELLEIIPKIKSYCIADIGPNYEEYQAKIHLNILIMESEAYFILNDIYRLKILNQNYLSTEPVFSLTYVKPFIYEFRAKIFFINKFYDQAFIHFFEAFNSYNNQGGKRKYLCISMIFLCNTLKKYSAKIFNVADLASYQNVPDIDEIHKFIKYYKSDDLSKLIDQYNSLINLYDDFCFKRCLNTFMINFKQNILRKTITVDQPTLTFEELAKVLHISSDEVEFFVFSTVQRNIKLTYLIDLPERRIIFDSLGANALAKTKTPPN